MPAQAFIYRVSLKRRSSRNSIDEIPMFAQNFVMLIAVSPSICVDGITSCHLCSGDRGNVVPCGWGLFGALSMMNVDLIISITISNYWRHWRGCQRIIGYISGETLNGDTREWRRSWAFLRLKMMGDFCVMVSVCALRHMLIKAFVGEPKTVMKK